MDMNTQTDTLKINVIILSLQGAALAHSVSTHQGAGNKILHILGILHHTVVFSLNLSLENIDMSKAG